MTRMMVANDSEVLRHSSCSRVSLSLSFQVQVHTGLAILFVVLPGARLSALAGAAASSESESQSVLQIFSESESAAGQSVPRWPGCGPCQRWRPGPARTAREIRLGTGGPDRCCSRIHSRAWLLTPSPSHSHQCAGRGPQKRVSKFDLRKRQRRKPHRLNDAAILETS
jgi:hypothetical protein